MGRKEQNRRRYCRAGVKIHRRRGNEAEALEFSRNSILRVAVGPLGNTELLPGFGAWFLELFWDLELGIWSFHPAQRSMFLIRSFVYFEYFVVPSLTTTT
jgi:hypothetical protein